MADTHLKNQNTVLTASMIRQMSPRDLFADNAGSSRKRRGFQTKAYEAQEEELEQKTTKGIWHLKVKMRGKMNKDQRRILRGERRNAKKQKKRELRKQKEEEMARRKAQLQALDRAQGLEAERDQLQEGENPAKVPLRPLAFFIKDPDAYITAAEQHERRDKPRGLGLVLPDIQPTPKQLLRAQKSPASTSPYPSGPPAPDLMLKRRRWMRDRMWDKRMEKFEALELRANAARRSPKYSKHWQRAVGHGAEAMAKVTLAARLGVHNEDHDVLEWAPPGLDDGGAQVSEDELKESWRLFVQSKPPKVKWKIDKERKDGVPRKYLLRHKVLDEKERLKRAMGRVDYNEWALLTSIKMKRERRWERERTLAEEQEREREQMKMVVESDPSRYESWYDHLTKELGEVKDKRELEGLSDKNSITTEDGSDEFDELQSLIDKKGGMTTEGKEEKKKKKGKEGKKEKKGKVEQMR